MGALDVIFHPRSVAVVGASRDEGKIGHVILHNLLSGRFEGTVYPVNPTATAVHGVRAYPSLLAIPDPVDLAIVVVPGAAVEAVFQECVAKGVRGAVVISAGFGEVGGEGSLREQRLVEIAKAGGMRFVGPNCMGIINTDPGVRLNATFAPTSPPIGSIAFMTQSGALGVAILAHAHSERIGISKFVSMGNKADVSGNDLLLDFGQDPHTSVILMYLENFGNPRNFIPIAREVTMRKPVIAVKSGRSTAGARAASSHTGSLAGTDIGAAALLKQCGVLRATSIEELFDLGAAFANQPLPAGPRVGILTNAGGPAIMTADAAEGAGLKVPPLSEPTQAALRALLPSEASMTNPVDMIASATPQQYEKATTLLLQDPAIDLLVVLSVPLSASIGEPVAAAVVRGIAASGVTKPVLACVMGGKQTSPGIAHLLDHHIPCYLYPESAVRAAVGMVEYARWRTKDKGTIPQMPQDQSAIGALLSAGQGQPQGRLTDSQSRALLEAIGVTFAPSVLATTLEGALDAAAMVGFPLVLKLDSPTLVHKSDVGGVRLGIADEAELVRQWRELQQVAKAAALPLNGIRVEHQVRGGKEVIVGMSVDPKFGPMVMVGMGGTYVEVLKDVAFRLAPLTTVDAAEVLAELRGFPILRGVRGEPPSDIAALQDLVLRVSALASSFPQIAELDLNPVLVLPQGQGVVAVDSRLRVNPPAESAAAARPVAGHTWRRSTHP